MGVVCLRFITSQSQTATAVSQCAHSCAEEFVGEGDRGAERWVCRGAQQGEFQGSAATGKTVRVPAILFDWMATGKTVEFWDQFDGLSFTTILLLSYSKDGCTASNLKGVRCVWQGIAANCVAAVMRLGYLDTNGGICRHLRVLIDAANCCDCSVPAQRVDEKRGTRI